MTEQQVRFQLDTALKTLNLDLHPSGVFRGARASWYATFNENVNNLSIEPFPQTPEECLEAWIRGLSDQEYAKVKRSN
jgi:hypothetical protein